MDLRRQNENILQWLGDLETESISDNQSQSSASEDSNHLETEIHTETDGNDEDAADLSDDEFFVPRRSRSRRLVIDSDDDTSLTSGMDQMDSEHEELPQQQSIIQPRQNILYGKNQHKWSTKPRDPRTRAAARNVLHIVPGPAGMAKELTQPKDLFYLFPIRTGKKPMKRRPFAIEMADELMKPWLQERYQTVTLQRNLKQIIAEVLKIDDPQEGSSQDVPRTRKTCSYCPAKKRRMTTNFCKGCKKAICREHIVSMCNHCSL